MRPDLERRYINACDCITKRREKLQKFHDYNTKSASFFNEYHTCQQQYLSGLAQVQNSKAWNSASGTFDLGLLDMSWAADVNERWNQREKMKEEELKKADEAVVEALGKHGLTKDDLVQVTDTEEIVYQKYIQFAKLGLNPHTGLPLTDSEKVKFQYAAHAGTWSNLIGTVGGAYAGQKAASNDFYSKNQKLDSVNQLKDPYQGVKEASNFLQENGVPRAFRKQVLESFVRETISVDTATSQTYGLRFYGGGASPEGRYLFETFTDLVNRQNLALPAHWNSMENIAQFQVSQGSQYISGVVGPQLPEGLNYVGGAKQWYIPNLNDLTRIK